MAHSVQHSRMGRSPGGILACRCCIQRTRESICLLTVRWLSNELAVNFGGDESRRITERGCETLRRRVVMGPTDDDHSGRWLSTGDRDRVRQWLVVTRSDGAKVHETLLPDHTVQRLNTSSKVGYFPVEILDLSP